MRCVFFIFFVFSMIFLSGCYTLIEKKENARIVSGWGVDIGFYSYPSIRFGKYDYVIIREKDK